MWWVTAVCLNNPKHIFERKMWVGSSYPKFCSYFCHDEYRRSPKQIEKRFWSSVDMGSEGECWPWLSGKDSDGYGLFGYVRKKGQPKTVRATRFAYRLIVGKIPKGLQVCHTCDNPGCVNVAHFFLATNEENTWDKVLKGRQARGERGRGVWFEESEIHRIITLHRSGYTDREIAEIFAVSTTTISKVYKGKHWSVLERQL